MSKNIKELAIAAWRAEQDLELTYTRWQEAQARVHQTREELNAAIAADVQARLDADE